MSRCWGSSEGGGDLIGQGQLPYITGQWAGPIHLDMTEANTFSETHEIAHSAVLPPPDTDHDLVRILFWNRINTPGGDCVPGVPPCAPPGKAHLFGRAYCIDPNAVSIPRSMIRVEVDKEQGSLNPGYDDWFGSQSLFCGGQAFLPDGDLLVLGGTDRPGQCSANSCQSGLGVPGHGHTLVARLDTAIHPPEWMALDPLIELSVPRWYGSAISLEDGSIQVAGHTGGPDPSYDERRDLILYNAFTNSLIEVSGLVNATKLLDTGSMTYDCPSAVQLGLTDYPRMHMLSTGDIMETMGTYRNPQGALEPRTRFMDRVVPFECQFEDWIETASRPESLRYGGNSVHLLPLNPTLPGTRLEVVYAVGGGIDPNESSCMAGEVMTASVQRMKNPSASAAWESVAGLDDDPIQFSGDPPVVRPRKNHNTVILLDGSLLVVGGESNVDNGAGGCSKVLEAERFKPEEVFHNSAPSWKDVESQSIGRGYHSTAGLLPDGRVFVAGGVDVSGSGPSSSRQTVEFYAPAYCFEARPAIDETSFSSFVVEYGQPLQFHASLVGSDPEYALKRIALLRASAATHAWDFNQRYVELTFELDPQSTHSDQILAVAIPAASTGAGSGAYILPPGDYILTVIDERHVPSPGVWIRIQHPQ